MRSTQRWKGLRFTQPLVTYKAGKRVGKWKNGHRPNPTRKRRGRRHPAQKSVKK